MKILIVLTSHDTLGNTGQKTGFWLEEFAAPYYIFIDAGADVILASPAGGQPPLDPKSSEPDYQTEATRRFDGDKAAQEKLAATLPLKDIKAEDFDAIFYPGGHGPMWDLATDEINAKLAGEFYNRGKAIGAVCHGPAALVKAKDKQGNSILQGRSLTCFTNVEETTVELDKIVPFLLETRLQELGGIFSNAEAFSPHCVCDGQIVTGQNPPSSEPAAKAILEMIQG
ncbi:MAG: type 1 glutamine amidotransferase domain-containing protein [Cyanobacteria bacterium SBLK]|nr:type 1 glutamine amidotransferase domain-containing protein [Cyanobacteria bacterium SBLK]